MENYFAGLAIGAIELSRKGFPPKRMDGYWVEFCDNFSCILDVGNGQKFVYQKIGWKKFWLE